jgi:hypothetical protein
MTHNYRSLRYSKLLIWTQGSIAPTQNERGVGLAAPSIYTLQHPPSGHAASCGLDLASGVVATHNTCFSRPRYGFDRPFSATVGVWFEHGNVLELTVALARAHNLLHQPKTNALFCWPQGTQHIYSTIGRLSFSYSGSYLKNLIASRLER